MEINSTVLGLKNDGSDPLLSNVMTPEQQKLHPETVSELLKIDDSTLPDPKKPFQKLDHKLTLSYLIQSAIDSTNFETPQVNQIEDSSLKLPDKKPTFESVKSMINPKIWKAVHCYFTSTGFRLKPLLNVNSYTKFKHLLVDLQCSSLSGPFIDSDGNFLINSVKEDGSKTGF